LRDAEVTKMMKAFGAPIDPGDAKIFSEYLARNYGHCAEEGAIWPRLGVVRAIFLP
jgi:hypothetical protein